MSKTPNWFHNAWPPALLLILFWGSSFYGLDFGAHWDEDRGKFDAVRKSIDRGILLQSIEEPRGYGYNYGGVNYWLTWSGMAPDLAKWFIKGPRTQEGWYAAMGPLVYTPKIRLRVRAIYVLLSSLSIVWIYCLCLVLDRSRRESFLAAAILSFSWEIAYHSRWAAPDVVMMQFALLAVLCLGVAMKRRSLGWFYVSAIAVGLTAGTKYTGVLILPFVLAGAARSLWYERPSIRYAIKHVVFLAGTTVLTFVITTPGSVLDPFRFHQQITEQQQTYKMGLFGYTVKPGVDYLLGLLRYFSLQGFSHYWSISILFGGLCLFGLVAIARERRLIAALVTGFLIVYFGLFSRQSIFLVRNFLVILPFLSIAASRGITAMSRRLGTNGARILQAIVGVALFINLGWEVYAAQQIGKRGDFEYFLRQFEDYAQASPKETFFVSAELLADLNRLPDPLPNNVTGKLDSAFTKVALLQSQGPDTHSLDWPANFWDTYDRTFGAQEVNLEAYPTFLGNERILVVSKKSLARLPVTPKSLAAPKFTVSKTEVVAGTDFYDVSVRLMPASNVIIRYSLNGTPPLESPISLDARGEKRVDIGPATAKGRYRLLGFRKETESTWHDLDLVVVVK